VVQMLVVNLPDLGEGVTEGEMVKWLVNIGDNITADQPVAEIMTDKATVEVPSPFSGKVIEFKAQEGDIVPIETALLTLEGDESQAHGIKSNNCEPAGSTVDSQAVNAEAASTNSVSRSIGNNEAGALITPPVAGQRVLASPSTRKLAREKNIDINQLNGTGPVGRVTRDDVLGSGVPGAGATTSNTPVAKLAIPDFKSQGGALEEREPIRGIRRKIVAAMQLSKQVIPHFTLMDEAVVTQLVETRMQMKVAAEEYGVKVTYLPLVMKALIATCKKYPMLNASIDDNANEIVYKKYFNLGFAADTPNGLVVPVIKNADQKTILQISAEINELAIKAREGKLAPADLKDATITVTNIGTIGGTYATPIINHPQVAILGMYKMVNKPVWKEDKFVPEKVMNFTITADHRLIDGAVAARFLSDFLAKIESPSKMLLEMV
jgi:pyruvate dehydrogenase E2 component (dihydrolipoamide acetyltransferase)